MVDRATATQLKLDVWSVVEVGQLYGIEISEFPDRIAATALWMMDHIMDTRLSLEFSHTYARVPIEKSPHIRNPGALEIDWAGRQSESHRSTSEYLFLHQAPP